MTGREAAGDERRHLRAVARGSAATLAGALVSTVAGFGLVLLVTRTVAPDTAGRFFAVSAVFLVGLAAAGLGTDTGLARFVLRNGEPAAVCALVRTAGVPVMILSCALTLLWATWWPEARSIAWALPFAAAADLCLAALRAHAMFKATVLIDRIVRPGLQVALVAGIVIAGGSGQAIAAAWASAYVVSAALSLRALRPALSRSAREVGARPGDKEPVETRAFWSFTWPRAVARIAQVAVQKLDIVLVAWLLSPRDAALYTVATRFVVFGQLANQAVSSVVQPRFTMILAEREADGADNPVLARVFGVTSRWSVLMAWPVYLCVAAAPSAYLGWFGAAYTTSDAVTVTVVMAAGMLVAVASGPVDTLLLMTGRSGWSLANTLVALVIDIGLCLVLLPRLGIAGAAIAWVVAVVVRCLLAVVQLRLELGLAPQLTGLALAAGLSLLCVAAPIAVLDLLVGLRASEWLLACAGAGLIYLAAVWRLRTNLEVDVFIAGLRSGRRAVPA